MRSSRTFTDRRYATISSHWSPRARLTPTAPDPAAVERFAADLDRLIDPDSRLGIAVSGGPDSLALLLLAAAARPQRIEAATVDHALRPESRAEAAMVAGLCQSAGVPHSILTAEWKEKPATAIQERARAERYRLLARWLDERRLDALVTGHHLDDQAETLLMRLNRGSGVRGLAGMRDVAPVPGARKPLLRPLLTWRRSELEAICSASGVQPIDDPSNADEQFERVRIRRNLVSNDWLDPEAMARSASHLADADAALDWAAQIEWESGTAISPDAIAYRPQAPEEIRRRVVCRAVMTLALEGQDKPIRGAELDRLLAALTSGGTATLRGVLCSGGEEWRFTAAPRRRSP